MIESFTNERAFASFNSNRRESASKRTVAQARESLAVIGGLPKDRIRNQYMAVLRMRVQYPDASLRELARSMRISKDTYACRLRRALNYAGRKAS